MSVHETICEYVEHQLDTFAERPLGEVDSLVLAWVSNFRLEVLGEALQDWDGLRVPDLLRAEYYEYLFDVWDPDSCKRLLQAMAASPRFRTLRVCGQHAQCDISDPEHPMQFSAVTFVLNDADVYISYRGSDTTLAGWRENFNMTFERPVPAQATALSYLEEVGQRFGRSLVVGGHSKGGNLAVYAAAEARGELQQRITDVYSHDGLGFDPEFLAREGFRRIRARVHKTVPQSSVVGMILEHQHDYSIVRSSSVGIFQHNPFSWIVEGASFARAEKVSVTAYHLDTALNAWIAKQSPEDRERFTREFYSLLDTTNATRIEQMRDEWQTSLPSMAHYVAHMDTASRRFLLKSIAAFLRELLPMSSEADELVFKETLNEIERVSELPKTGDTVCKRISRE